MALLHIREDASHLRAIGRGRFRRRLLAFTLPYSPRYHCARTAIVSGGSDSPSTVVNCSFRWTRFHCNPQISAMFMLVKMANSTISRAGLFRDARAEND